MDKNIVESFCEKLNDYLQDEFGYKKRYAYVAAHGLRVLARTQQYDLYFRFYPTSQSWENKTLVIVRIGFEQTHAGHGTRLMQFVYEQAKEFGYEYVAIDRLHKDESWFAMKFGFEQVSNANWSISVDKLTAYFH